MIYSELKAMSCEEMLALLASQLDHARSCLPSLPGADYRSRELPAPLLGMIGDFEIRARFPDPEPKPCSCSCKP